MVPFGFDTDSRVLEEDEGDMARGSSHQRRMLGRGCATHGTTEADRWGHTRTRAEREEKSGSHGNGPKEGMGC